VTAKWLFYKWPFLVPASYNRVVRIDSGSWVRTTVDVCCAEHYFGKPFESTTLACGFGTHNIFDGITCRAGYDAATRIGLNRSREET
jgi:hypothetical protein